MKKINNKGFTHAQSIAFAFAFVGEHKDLFEQWLAAKLKKEKEVK